MKFHKFSAKNRTIEPKNMIFQLIFSQNFTLNNRQKWIFLQCIPLYWLIVSTTGMAQAQMLRHPKIKGIFGIKKLPTDSATPIRDLFKMRNV